MSQWMLGGSVVKGTSYVEYNRWCETKALVQNSDFILILLEYAILCPFKQTSIHF